MPAGLERDRMESSIDFQARRIREYRTRIPGFLKVAGWASTAALMAALISALLFGTDVNGIEWTLVAIALLSVIVFLPIALWGWLPFRYRAGFIESDDAARRARASAPASRRRPSTTQVGTAVKAPREE